DSAVVENVRVGHYRLHSPYASRPLGLPHPVAADFSTPELHFLPVSCEILLHHDDEIGIREALFVTGCRAEHLRISASTHLVGHRWLPRTQERLISIGLSANFP